MKHQSGEDMPELREEIEQRVGEFEAELYATHVCQTELRVRIFTGGSKHYVHQCLTCGEQQGNARSAVAALQELDGREPIPFDTALADSYAAKRSSRWHEYTALKKHLLKLEGDPWVDRFEADKAKQEKAAKAIEELMTGLSEQLSEPVALTVLERYLVAMRKRRWEAELANAKRFPSEPALKEWLTRNLSPDFELTPEVRGVHLAEQVGVCIDYVARAKPHLIAEGFTEEVFGIEVKHLKPEQEFSSKTSRGFWQTISYTDCHFTVDGAPTRLKFALLFSDFSFKSERALLKNFGGSENDRVGWESLRQLANHAQVGTLYINGTQDDHRGWSIKFSGGTYFSARGFKGDWTYQRSNTDLIDKARVGNF